MDRIEGKLLTKEPLEVRIAPTLVIRESTRAVWSKAATYKPNH
jgi:hypothetical protein